VWDDLGDEAEPIGLFCSDFTSRKREVQSRCEPSNRNEPDDTAIALVKSVANFESPNLAVSEAMRRSQARANSKPPPIAWPLIAAMMGFVIRCCPRVMPPPMPSERFLGHQAYSLSPLGIKVFRSAPEQKAFPAPVRMATSSELSLQSHPRLSKVENSARHQGH